MTSTSVHFRRLQEGTPSQNSTSKDYRNTLLLPFPAIVIVDNQQFLYSFADQKPVMGNTVTGNIFTVQHSKRLHKHSAITGLPYNLWPFFATWRLALANSREAWRDLHHIQSGTVGIMSKNQPTFKPLSSWGQIRKFKLVLKHQLQIQYCKLSYFEHSWNMRLLLVLDWYIYLDHLQLSHINANSCHIGKHWGGKPN